MKSYEQVIEYMEMDVGGLSLVVRDEYGNTGRMSYEYLTDMKKKWLHWHGPGPDGEKASNELREFQGLPWIDQLDTVFNYYNYKVVGVHACREDEHWEQITPVWELDEYYDLVMDLDRMTEKCSECGATRTLLRDKTYRDREVKGGHLPHDALTKMGLILATTKEK